MKPFDIRLLKYAQSARRYIIEIAVLGLLTAALVITQAFLISGSASPVITRGASLSEVLPTIGLLGLVVAVRAGLIYLREARSHRAADQAIASLRSEVTKKAVRLGPRWRARHGTETATLLTRGLDDLEPYFVKFLPQLLLVVTVTPLALLTILILDFWSALIAFLTIPLIPIFMVLIGRMTQGFSSKKLIAMERLGAQLLDLLTGLPTLRAIGREKGPREHLIRLGNQNTRTTMQTLRVAFLSGGVLEFLATLSVALVAVQVGMRMVFGELDLFYGLIIIMLAPEVFEPLRAVGTQFHASTNGVAAADQAFEILEEDEPARGNVSPAPAGRSPIIIDDLYVAARGTWAPAGLSATIHPGQITAFVGPSGSGKSTTVQVLLGFEDATRGMIAAQSSSGEITPVSEFDRTTWWEGISWIPQHPTILPGTVLSNVVNLEEGAQSLSADSVDQSRLSFAAAATGFDAVVKTLPEGWQTMIGAGGIGLSVGQRQRLALTRTLMNPPSLLVLDEPTAHLDALSEEQIISVLEELRESGTTIVAIAHRQAVVRVADQVLEIHPRVATTDELAEYPQLTDGFELEDLSGVLPGFLASSTLNQAGASK